MKPFLLYERIIGLTTIFAVTVIKVHLLRFKAKPVKSSTLYQPFKRRLKSHLFSSPQCSYSNSMSTTLATDAMLVMVIRESRQRAV